MLKAYTLSTATKRITELEEALHRAIADITWFNSILAWALNRSNNTPHALLNLIREGASKRFSEAVMRRGEKIPDKPLQAEGAPL